MEKTLLEYSREIETLKAAKADIKHRISVLEARLHDIPPPNDAVSGVSCSPMSIADSAAGHGLSPEIIYHYNSHLLLPSFGVQANYTEIIFFPNGFQEILLDKVGFRKVENLTFSLSGSKTGFNRPILAFQK